ncbi:MAG: vWA domain-containing protein [Gaiellaceae bacterium]
MSPRSLLALVSVVACAIAGSATGAAAQPAAGTSLVDIEIAIDTTGSMGGSITQAQNDAKTLVADVRARYQGAMFAVVQFRDKGDSPEYQVMQSMTADGTLVDAAVDRLSPGGGGDDPEALDLVFHNSVADGTIGWRAGSRKIVVVISDAEPHGAGAAGYKGCRDSSTDPFGIGTTGALAEMRAAGRTLLLVRQASTATVTLECYQSLAAAAYTGSAARNSGDKLIQVIEALITKAVQTKPSSKIKSISFTFTAYANNVRVGPPLVGRFQLGVARVSGSGTIDGTGRLVKGGTIRDTDTPNRFTRPPRGAAIWARVVYGKKVTISPDYTKLELVVQVNVSATPESCVVGTRGLVTLVNDDRAMANSQSSDTVVTIYPQAGGVLTAPDRGRSCRTHHQGWSNADNPNTDPTRGGPGGGQWADVKIGIVRG